jgi:predicted permease
MRLLNSLRRRLQSFLHKDAGNFALSEELQFHLEQLTEENIAHGMPPLEARRAAEAEFGSIAQAMDACYEARGITLLDDLAQDIRYGLRTLARNRGFTIVTILTLALGIGASTAIFSLVNAVLLRSLPYGDPDRLVHLFTPNPHLKVPVEVFGPSNADFFDLKAQTRSFAAMTLFKQQTYNLAVDDQPQRIGASKVDADFFNTLQVAPALGRGFTESDEMPGNDHEVILSDGLWRSLFAGSPDVLGRMLRLNGQSYRIVGVMPEGFGFPHKTELQYGNGFIETTQLWVPLALTAQEKADRDNSSYNVMARLKTNITVNNAQAEMSTVMARLDKLHHGPFTGWTGLVEPFRENMLAPIRPLLWLLLGAVGCVLLIACGNAAGLLLARAATRAHELGVRASLGATRGRLLRQMLTESVMLSVAAGIVGIALAYFFLHALLALDPGDIPRMESATLDIRVLGFLILITLFTGVFFGVLPSLSATRINLADFLKNSGMRGITGERHHIRSVLVTLQMTLVVVLLVGAGLFLRSYAKVLSVPTGFSPLTVAVNITLTPQYDTPQKRRVFFEDLLRRIKPVHGIEAAGLVNYLPLNDSESMSTLWVDGYPNEKDQLVEERAITAGYLSSMQTSLLQGRGFSDAANEHSVAIVNQAFVNKYLANGEAIDRRLRTDPNGPWSTIIGVIEDVRNESLEAAPAPQIYFPFLQGGFVRNSVYLAVRSSLPQSNAVSAVRSAVHSIDPNLPISDVHLMGDLRSKSMARRRFQTTLLSFFSAIALFLALVGVYGLLAYSVRQKTGEIGLRMALGSSRAGVMRLILRRGLALFALGLTAGTILAIFLARLLRGFLFGVPAFDPITFALVPVLLFIATLAACLVPGWRASSIDPMTALRHE